ncbi:phosphoribosylaminoimidazole synthetase [bacterium SM23_57]|nr:MAG: phosphoribosylaminoimidazole synthetase [bacterium SM23_57]
MNYRSAGVNLEEAQRATSNIGELVRSTFNSQVLDNWGQFGGCFAPDFSHLKKPVLVSSTDSVGTKLLVAIKAGIHDTIGQDIVNHCVNDILTCGASPLFFLDYIGIGTMDAIVVEQIVKGIAIACRENRCALIGGELAEMPDIYKKKEYDLVGTIVGIVDHDNLIDGSSFVLGDVLVGFPSNGLHTNGYSLARKVLLDGAKFDLEKRIDDLDGTLGEKLLQIHKSYLHTVQHLLAAIEIKAMAHITGGGLEGNISRVVPKGMKAVIEWSAWQMPPIFALIQKQGRIATEEMRRVFNMGIGFVIGCRKEDVDQVLKISESKGEKPMVIGEIVSM